MDQGRIDKIVRDTFWEELPGVLLFLAIGTAAAVGLIFALPALLSERQTYYCGGIIVALIVAAWWVFRDPALFDEADRNSRIIR